MKSFSLWVLASVLLMIALAACQQATTSAPATTTNNTAASTYTVSGTVTLSGTGLSGVTVALSGSATSTTKTSTSGAFSFTVSAGSYKLTPSLNGYSFSPTSTSVTVTNASSTANSFAATSVPTYSVTGSITGSVISGVTVTASGSGTATTTSGSSGNFSLNLSAGTYTLTPSLSGYQFSPTTLSVTVSSAAVAAGTFTCSVSTVGDQTSYTGVSLTSGGVYSSSASGISESYYQYTSAVSDAPAIKVAPGGSLTVVHSKVNKTTDTVIGTQDSGFYGFNGGVLASSSSAVDSYVETGETTTATLTNTTINTAAVGANGAFAFGEGAVVNLDHATIVTTGGSNSRGVDATYGGTVNITNSTISTQGGSCAALATDRYNGATAPHVTAVNCTGTTAGTGSPCIYCTGTIKVTDCTLAATGSEAAVIEGLNSITLSGSSIAGAAKWGVMIYQSMSGDSSSGTGTFTMTGGTLSNAYTSGPAFFVCDTAAVISLSGTSIANSSGMLLVAGTASSANALLGNIVNTSWGSNGGVVTLNAVGQTLAGTVTICDTSSSVTMSLDSASTWTVPGNSYVTTLINNGTINLTGGNLYVTTSLTNNGTINLGSYHVYLNGSLVN
jgi:hypothetical protein